MRYALALTLISSLLLAEECCPEPGFFSNDRSSSYRVTARTLQGTGIGFNRGYSSLDLFLSRSVGCNLYSFLDLRGHIFNNIKWAANAGLGLRWAPECTSHVYGLNVFYDFRKPNHHPYHQIGGGLELLTECWSLRANGYFPISDRTHRLKEGFRKFQDHQAIFSRKDQFTFIGGDLEIGRQFLNCRYLDLEAIAGGYYLSGKFGKNAAGGLLKLKADVTRFITLQGQGSYDSYFNWRGSGEARINIPFGPRVRLQRENPCCDETIESRLVESVDRFEIIPIASHTKRGPALDPTTGEPLFFVFVDNQRGSSDGSFENPYPTLIEAQNNSRPGNVIYVFAGDGTSKGMDQGIILQDNQRFLGSGVDHTFHTRFGDLPIPPQTQLFPLIQSPSLTNTVFLANNNEVSGFNIQGAPFGSIGILGEAIRDALITKNRVTDFFVGIGFSDCSGTITIRDNSIDLGGGGIIVQAFNFSSFNALISHNKINGSKPSISIIARDNANLFATAFENEISNAETGVDISSTVNARLSATITSNKITSSSVRGIKGEVSGAATASITINNNLVQGLDTNSNSMVFTNNGSDLMIVSASNNELILNGGPFQIDTPGAGSTSVELINNRSDNSPGYFLNQTVGPIFLKTLINNIGEFSQAGTITIAD